MPFSGEKKPFWLQCQIGEVFNASFPSDKKKEKPLAYNRVKVFKNGPSKICGKQPLKNLKCYGLPQQNCDEIRSFLKVDKDTTCA